MNAWAMDGPEHYEGPNMQARMYFSPNDFRQQVWDESILKKNGATDQLSGWIIVSDALRQNVLSIPGCG